ncbi:MAG: DUF1579 domain-containing protein [Nitrosomonas sp.]|nr:DUF1579 domain-containing protein [Nitrosomonas sp.]
MRYMQLIFVVFSTLILISVATADDKHVHKPIDPQEMMEIYAKLATPGEPHKLFATLTGSWTTKTKEWMDPQKPFVESTGSVDIKMLLGGRFLQQEVTGSMHGKPYSAIWTIAYDNLLKQYVSTWINTMSTQIFIMEGTASTDGKVITFTGQHAEIGGGHMTHRAIWKIEDSNNREFVMYGTYHGGKEMKMLETTYKRKQ